MSNNVVLFRLRESHAIVGVVEDKTEHHIYLSIMAKIRYWGTTKGFEELVTGPTAKTILDRAEIPMGTRVEITRSQILYSLPGVDEAWLKVLA